MIAYTYVAKLVTWFLLDAMTQTVDRSLLPHCTDGQGST